LSGTAASYARLTIASGGTASGDVINGLQDVAGTAIETKVIFGEQSVEGTTTDTTITAENSFQLIYAGGIASGTTLDDSGKQEVYSNGTALATIIIDGVQSIFTGGSAVDTTISNGGAQADGGVASGTTISSGGGQGVDAVAINTTVLAGGTLDIQGGFGPLRNLGGTVYGATVDSGGSVFVESFGTLEGGTIISGGTETVAGIDVGAQVSGGTETVLSGGVATSDTVFTGSQVVSSGGTAIHDTISGGAVVLEPGAVVSGGIAFANRGTLEILGSAIPSATISGFSSGDVIDLASVAPAAGGIAVLTSGNVLDVVEGGSTYVLDLNPSQNYSVTKFALTSDGSGGTEITNVLDPISVTVSSGTLTVSSGHTSVGVLVRRHPQYPVRRHSERHDRQQGRHGPCVRQGHRRHPQWRVGGRQPHRGCQRRHHPQRRIAD
jgi:autotransporter passenger strand-loop-strand repeat protein